MFTKVGQSKSLCCDSVSGGGAQEGTIPLAQLSPSFQSLPLLSTSKLGPSGVDSLVGVFEYVLGPGGSGREYF